MKNEHGACFDDQWTICSNLYEMRTMQSPVHRFLNWAHSKQQLPIKDCSCERQGHGCSTWPRISKPIDKVHVMAQYKLHWFWRKPQARKCEDAYLTCSRTCTDNALNANTPIFDFTIRSLCLYFHAWIYFWCCKCKVINLIIPLLGNTDLHAVEEWNLELENYNKLILQFFHYFSHKV